MQLKQFQAESDAVEVIVSRLEPQFHLLPEVWMRHFDGSRVRIDLLCLPRKSAEVPHRFQLFGVEVKAGYEGLRDFNKALKQAIDYRHSFTADDRTKRYIASIPDFVFVYPDFHVDPVESPIYNSGYYGSVRLAGMFNVGVIREVTRWRGGTQLEFRVSDTAIWRSAEGVVNGANFGTARRRGAA